MKAMENELQDKAKVDRGLLNSWFVEVQRTKVNRTTYLTNIEKIMFNIVFRFLRKKLINVESDVIRQSKSINNFDWPFKKLNR